MNRSANDGTITRFGWKAQNKSLLLFASEAYNVRGGDVGGEPMCAATDPKRVQRIFERARQWRFNPHPPGNLKDLFALLSVAAGLRRVAAFGFHDLSTEGFVRDLKDKVANLGFRTLITGPIPHDPSLALDGVDDAILGVIRMEGEDRFRRNKTMVLWVFSGSESRDRIIEVVRGDAEPGILLGYPQCCVDHINALKRQGDRAFLQGVLKAIGNDPGKVLKALREDLKVEIKDCAWESDNAGGTDAKYPFLLHIACDGCLRSDESPSALLNLALQRLAEEVGHGFPDTVRGVTKLDAELNRLIIDCERKGLGPDTIDQATREQLRRLSEQMDRMCAEFERG